MKCDAALSLLQPYLDGELDRAGVGELEAHLAGCESCRLELASLEELRTNVRSVSRYRAPRALREQIRSIDELSTQIGPARDVVQWRPWAIAASLLLAFVLGGTLTWLSIMDATHVDQRQALVRELLTSHLRSLAAASPVDVISEDRHTVKPWFAGRIGESPPVKDLAAQGFPLLGGRIDYVADRRTAVIVYRHRQHVIDVYLTPVAQKQDVQPPTQLQGYWMAGCRVDGRSAWIVTDIEERELLRFRDALGCDASLMGRSQ